NASRLGALRTASDVSSIPTRQILAVDCARAESSQDLDGTIDVPPTRAINSRRFIQTSLQSSNGSCADRLCCLVEQFAADQHAADFRGAGADLVELGVAQQAAG